MDFKHTNLCDMFQKKNYSDFASLLSSTDINPKEANGRHRHGKKQRRRCSHRYSPTNRKRWRRSDLQQCPSRADDASRLFAYAEEGEEEEEGKKGRVEVHDLTGPGDKSKEKVFWECHACTFLNDKRNATRCEMCETQRRTEKKPIVIRTVHKSNELNEKEEGEEKESDPKHVAMLSTILNDDIRHMRATTPIETPLRERRRETNRLEDAVKKTTKKTCRGFLDFNQSATTSDRRRLDATSRIRLDSTSFHSTASSSPDGTSPTVVYTKRSKRFFRPDDALRDDSGDVEFDVADGFVGSMWEGRGSAGL